MLSSLACSTLLSPRNRTQLLLHSQLINNSRRATMSQSYYWRRDYEQQTMQCPQRERSAELHRTYAFILNQPRTLNSPLSILLLPVCLPLLSSIISVAHHLLLNPPCRANNKYQTPKTTIPIINSPFLICKSTFLIIIINPLRAVFNLRIRIWPSSTPLWSAPSIDRQL